MSRVNTDTWSGAEGETSLNSTCSICKGNGVVHPLFPSGKPDYSRVIACRCTREKLDDERQACLQRYSNLGPLTRYTFDNLAEGGRSGNPVHQEQFARIYEAAKIFADNPVGWFVLNGPSGSGKTHLAAAIAGESISRGYPVFYVATPDLMDSLRSTFKAEREAPFSEVFEQVRNTPLLILDDLGVQSDTAWAREKLDQLLTYRFSSELSTVIVTSMPFAELDERLRMRLTDAKLSQVHTIEEKQSFSGQGWGSQFELQNNMTFSTFDWRRVNLTSEQRENLENVYQLTFDFAKSPEGWLVLMGETGCGKTHLAAAIVNYQYQANKPALFVVVPEFLDHLRSTFNPESKISYDQVFESVKISSLLVLDDFGEQSTTPWAREKLYQVINYRYNARLATVITTRYSIEEIYKEIDSSISSRLIDPKISTPLNIMAPDYRGDKPQPAQRKASRSNRRQRWD